MQMKTITSVNGNSNLNRRHAALGLAVCAALGAGQAYGQIDNQPWQGTSVTWTGAAGDGDWSNAANWTAVEGRLLQATSTLSPHFGPGDRLLYTNYANYLNGVNPTSYGNPIFDIGSISQANIDAYGISAGPTVTVTVPGNTFGISGTSNLQTNQNTYDEAVFGAGSNLQVNPEVNRRINSILFNNQAGDYIIGPASGASTLYLQGGITGNSANTVTFNSPIYNINDHTLSTVAGQVFDFNGAYQSQNGRSLNLNGAGTYNFDGGLMSTNPSAGRAGTNVNGTVTVNLNAPANTGTQTHRVGLTINAGGTVNLNAPHVIYGDLTSGGAGNDAQSSIKTGGSGTLNINAAHAVYGTANLWAGNTASGTTSVVTINHDQTYTGRRELGPRAGLGFGTLVGHVNPDTSSATERSKPILGNYGYTVSSVTTASPTLWVNNNADNAGASHAVGGSATGNSDVNIVTGLLGGNGFIVNTDRVIGTTTYEQGVTLHKRQQVTGLDTTQDYGDVTPDTLAGRGLTAVGAATYGKLSPGASAGATGTLTMDLGSKGLNIAYAVADANAQTLLFDLDTVASSDGVALLNDTVLRIGDSGLEFDDFVFTALGGFGPGVYTLFDTSVAIDGTLGAGLSGDIGGFVSTIGLGDGGNDIILTVVPEPAGLAVLGLAAMGLVARRRRA